MHKVDERECNPVCERSTCNLLSLLIVAHSFASGEVFELRSSGSCLTLLLTEEEVFLVVSRYKFWV